jgi:hypothetical protein
MSIGKRLIDLARSELNSLLDRASPHDEFELGERDPDDDLYQRYGMSAISDEELEAELERRAPPARPRPRRTRPRRAPRRAERARTPPPSALRTRRDPPRLRLAGGAAGSDFETVRKAYRTLMRKYHPDRHAQTPRSRRPPPSWPRS